MAGSASSVTSLYCWGSTVHGQLGLRGAEEERILLPRKLMLADGQTVTDIALGRQHTLLAINGLYSCGNNDYGQLGQTRSQSKPERIDVLANQSFRQLACGQHHSVALTDTGQLFSWGSNSCGQLGRGNPDETSCTEPKIVRSLSPYVIIQVACGYNHCLALSNYGSLYSWGNNSHGQLGLGGGADKISTPQLLSSLEGLALRQLAAGGHHSIVLTVSGSLYGWGRNNCGQLGLGDDLSDKFYPTSIKTLKSHGVRHVACGEQHTAVITLDGGVFTFGAGMYGQLGHNSTRRELLPRKVFELMGSVVTQIVCGRFHTLAYIAASGRLYAFGLGAHGQLGLGSSMGNQASPSMVKGPFVPTSGPQTSVPINKYNEAPVVLRKVYAGGDHSFVLAVPPESQLEPVDLRDDLPLSECVASFSEDRMRQYAGVPARGKPPLEILEDLENVVSSVACHNASFLQPVPDSLNCSSKSHGIDLEQAIHCYSRLSKLPNRDITRTIVEQIEQKLIPSLKSSPPDVESLRIYLTLPWCHAFTEPKHYQSLICPFARAITSLQSSAAKIIDRWWGQFCYEHLERLISVYKEAVMYILCLPPSTSQVEAVSRAHNIVLCLRCLKKLNQVNEAGRQIVPVESFYISALQEKIDMKMDYVRWITGQHQETPLVFCDFPFVFDAQAKTVLLHTDAMLQMRYAVDEVVRRNMSTLFNPTIDPVNPCLVLIVSRHNIVQDTILQINKAVQYDLKKPLKVVFKDEEAVDEGGVRKEFFLLMMREILDPKYGMFSSFEQSNLLWFQEQSFEDNNMYSLIGILCGLAIYNATIIDLKFPLALYKKLLKRPVTLEDMCELDPSLGRSLNDLLEYEDDDIEESLCLTFEITRELFGEVKHVPLLPNGGQVAVNKGNRQQYVNLYIDYVFNTSVREQFDAFHDGFHRVCGGKVLELFHPLELQSMVRGNENYDWPELQKNAEYKGVYHHNHPCIKMFWQVFHSLDQQDKKRFLLFLTGSDRIPIQGMKAVKIYIQPAGGGEKFLPVAHTCFNILDLPEYPNRDAMRQKLLLAIQHAVGFALV